MSEDPIRRHIIAIADISIKSLNNELTRLREENARLREALSTQVKEDTRVITLLRGRLKSAGIENTHTCKRCGQTDIGQTGEYPCDVCGLPALHDERPSTGGDGASRKWKEVVL